MPGCSALGCTNSASKGFLMKKIPKDPQRRKEWTDRMKRGHWKPSDHSCICEVHFEPHMWEVTRVDGTRKLKLSAVPTLFAYNNMKQPKDTSTTKSEQSEGSNSNILYNPDDSTSITDFSYDVSSDNDYLPNTNTDPDNTNTSLTVKDGAVPSSLEAISVCETQIDANSISDSTSNLNIPIKTESQLKYDLDLDPTTSLGNMSPQSRNILEPSNEEKLKMYERLYIKKSRSANMLKRKLRNARLKIKCLEQKQKDSFSNCKCSIMNSIFNSDQIRALGKYSNGVSTRFMKWSNATINKALMLKIVCGINGYNELLRQGIPLPSLRTVRRFIQSVEPPENACEIECDQSVE